MEENTQILSIKKGKIKNSEVEIEVTLAPEVLLAHKEAVLSNIKKDFSMPGFRKGMVPEKMILENVNQNHLLEDAAESAIKELYPEILAEAQIDPVTPPQISIVKIAEGSPLELKILVGVYPEITLPNYKKIAKNIEEKKEKAEVKEEEVEAVIAELQKMRQVEGGKDEIAPLTDEEVKKFGDFKDVADFKSKLKENLISEKAFNIGKQTRDKMIREIVEDSKITLPPILVAMEFAKFRDDFEERLRAGGETIEQYLERSKKTAEEVGKDQREYLERLIKTRFVLSEILRAENITAPAPEVEVEAEHVRRHRTDLTPEQAHSYAESAILESKLFDLLEGREKKEEAKTEEKKSSPETEEIQGETEDEAEPKNS